VNLFALLSEGTSTRCPHLYFAQVVVPRLCAEYMLPSLSDATELLLELWGHWLLTKEVSDDGEGRPLVRGVVKLKTRPIKLRGWIRDGTILATSFEAVKSGVGRRTGDPDSSTEELDDKRDEAGGQRTSGTEAESLESACLSSLCSGTVSVLVYANVMLSQVGRLRFTLEECTRATVGCSWNATSSSICAVCPKKCGLQYSWEVVRHVLEELGFGVRFLSPDRRRIDKQSEGTSEDGRLYCMAGGRK
jgi:hypothetical protein